MSSYDAYKAKWKSDEPKGSDWYVTPPKATYGPMPKSTYDDLKRELTEAREVLKSTKPATAHERLYNALQDVLAFDIWENYPVKDADRYQDEDALMLDDVPHAMLNDAFAVINAVEDMIDTVASAVLDD